MTTEIRFETTSHQMTPNLMGKSLDEADEVSSVWSRLGQGLCFTSYIKLKIIGAVITITC